MKRDGLSSELHKPSFFRSRRRPLSFFFAFSAPSDFFFLGYLIYFVAAMSAVVEYLTGPHHFGAFSRERERDERGRGKGRERAENESKNENFRRRRCSRCALANPRAFRHGLSVALNPLSLWI
jgi:hypothetical protein